MANPEHLERLLFSVPHWNEWRRANRSVEIDLSAADLRGRDLSSALLSKANLSKANLQKARMHKTGLGSANLAECDLTAADPTECRLQRANLSFATLDGAILSRAYCMYANLEWAGLDDVTGIMADFESANLRNTRCSRANFARSSFPWANLTCSVLDHANLSGGNFFGASLTGASLRGADLSGASLWQTVANRADLQCANLTCSCIRALSTWEAKLDGCVELDLLITSVLESDIRVDGLALGQMLQLVQERGGLPRHVAHMVLDAVMIVGTFSEESDPALPLIRQLIRRSGYSPIWCNPASPRQEAPLVSSPPFVPKPYNPDPLFRVLAALAPLVKLIIVDGKDEATQSVIPYLSGRSTPVLPIFHKSDVAAAEVFAKYEALPSVLYTDEADLARLLTPWFRASPPIQSHV